MEKVWGLIWQATHFLPPHHVCFGSIKTSPKVQGEEGLGAYRGREHWHSVEEMHCDEVWIRKLSQSCRYETLDFGRLGLKLNLKE